VTALATIEARRTLGTSLLLTVAEAAARLRLSRATVYRLVATGQLAAVRVSSGAIRIVAPA
jgi:excisionase family DNA binding protein